METAYDTPLAAPAGATHHYGDRVHILSDSFALTLLSRLCTAQVVQPEFNTLIATLYRHLMVAYSNTIWPTAQVEVPTRMADAHPGGVFRGKVFERDTSVVCVDVARAGILPSQVCFELANTLLEPSGVRQDHIVMARTVDESGAVVGADLSGAKIGGPIDGRHVLFPDPMGATGSSLDLAIRHYKTHIGAAPASISTLNLMVTPEYLRAMTERHPEVHVFALRVDRGASPADVQASPLGARWDEESGLTDVDYIVPGGGGFGELMNNSYC